MANLVHGRTTDRMGLATRLPPKYATGGLKTFENFFSVGHTKCQVVGSSTMLAVITSNTLLTTTMPSRTLVPAPGESSHGLESSPVNKRPRGRPEANSESDSLPAARSKSSPPTINSVSGGSQIESTTSFAPGQDTTTPFVSGFAKRKRAITKSTSTSFK